MAYSQRYDSLAWQIAREVFGDSELAQVFYRMMKQESGFDSDVVEGRRASSAGAQGIAQFMPATAREQGVDPLNPEEALRGAAAYLQKLISYFSGEVAKGVAAYNAGAGGVETAVQRGGANWRSALPGETQSYLQITQPGGTGMNGQDFPLGGRPMTPAATGQGASEATGGQVTPQMVIEWMVGIYGTLDEAGFYFAENPQGWVAYYREQMGLDTGVSDLERRETEAGIEFDEASARRIIAELGGNTYEQGRQRILDKMDKEKLGKEEAITEFNAWMTATLEAGRSGEKVYDEQMKRAAWTTPSEYYPGTEPGGARERFAEQYGVEYTPSPGVAVETLPKPEEMYSKWHQKMGISQQAPATAGGWSGQGLGVPQGQRWNAAQDFLQRMNLQQGTR